MKQKLLLAILFIGNAVEMNAQAPAWIWARSGGSASMDWSNSIASDLNGNIYAVGSYFDSSIAFGSTVLPNAGSDDIYIVKYDASGNLIWARRVGGINAERANRIRTDVNGDVLVTGFFRSPSLNFGGVLLTNSDPTGTTSDLFVAKYNPSGSVLWAHSAPGTPGNTGGGGICSDPFGNVFITGGFRDSVIIFGPDTLRNAGGVEPDIFVAKYDVTGTILWARCYGDSLSEQGMGCGTDVHGNLYVAGNFTSPSLSMGSTILSIAGGYDMFLAKFDSSGSVLWARSAGGISLDRAIDMCTDDAGNSYLTGEYFSPTINFGGTPIINSDTSTTTDDFFIVKYDALGNYKWSEGAGGKYLDGGSGICTDAYGNIYVTGYFEDSTITFGSHTLNHAGAMWTDDLILVKYDSSGTAAWAQSAAGLENEWGLSICSGIGGYLYVTGIYDDLACNFGSSAMGTVGSYDIFIAKLDYVTGLAEFPVEGPLEIFPNPSQGWLTIRTQRAMNKSEVQISNLMGQVVYTKTFVETNSFDIEMDVLPGIYFVTIIDDKGKKSVGKIVKQ